MKGQPSKPIGVGIFQTKTNCEKTFGGEYIAFSICTSTLHPSFYARPIYLNPVNGETFRMIILTSTVTLWTDCSQKERDYIIVSI